MKIPIDNNIKDLHQIFKKHSFSLYVVGGAVRDILLNIKVDDIDFATSATPEEMLNIFKNAIKTGIKHGTLTIPFRKKYYEVTTFREEEGYSDSRHPDILRYTSDIKSDLSRRDFTINAMAADIETGEIIDPFSGIEDLKKKLVRAVGIAINRFTEDALRMMRAIRFAVKLNFKIENKTYDAIKKLSKNIALISKERIRDEILKIIQSKNASYGLELLKDTKILCYTISGLYDDISDSDKEAFIKEKLDICSLKGAETEFKIATLLYYRNDYKDILRGLKFSNYEINTISMLLENKKINSDTLSLKKLICRYDRIGALKIIAFFKICNMFSKASEELETRYNKICNEPCKINELDINGNDLKDLNISGKYIGDALSFLLEKVMINPILNKKDTLLELIEDKKSFSDTKE